MNTDGSLDQTFNAGQGASFQIRSLAIQEDGKILVAGVYGSFNGATYPHLTRLHPNGSVDESFNPGGSGPQDGMYSVKILRNRKILLGGFFSSYNGQVSPEVARLHPDGSLDNSFNAGPGLNPDNEFSAGILITAEQSDEKVMIAYFTIVNGRIYYNLARLIGKYPPPALPLITAASSLTFCQGDSVTLSAPSGFASYLWSNGATTRSIQVKQSGSFTLQVKQANTDFSQPSNPIVVQVNALPNLPP